MLASWWEDLGTHPFEATRGIGSAASGRREVIGLPAGRTEAGDEAREAGETSVESPKGDEFEA